MEISTKENESLLSAVYERVMAAVHAEKVVSEQESFVFQIELLSQEINSGASFEQYFRWVEKPELDGIVYYVKNLDIPELVNIVEEAIKVAFPNGIPEGDEEYEECIEWSESQEVRLEELFELFEEYNGTIINKLGTFIKENSLA
ncbi:MAG: hypothetical protein HRU20_00220 [Pseudomonadales bacterium]|nr:hypothetical protein [Pseudomonadales bacterium]